MRPTFLCFSMMLTHNVLLSSFSKVILTPIVKDKPGNVFDKDNYRSIAVATVSSKILERAILSRCGCQLTTSDHQFGFKERHSADMAVYMFLRKSNIFFWYDRFCSASNMFVCERVDSFRAMHRKTVFRFMCRLSRSNNHTV